MAGYDRKNYDPSTPVTLIRAADSQMQRLIRKLNTTPALAKKISFVLAFAKSEKPKIRGVSLESLGMKNKLFSLLSRKRADALFTRIGELYFAPADYSANDRTNRDALEPLFATLYPEFVEYLFRKSGKADFDNSILTQFGKMANRIAVGKYPQDKKVLLDTVRISHTGRRKALVEGIKKVLENERNLNSALGRRKIAFAFMMAPHAGPAELMPLAKRYATDPRIAAQFPALKRIGRVAHEVMMEKVSRQGRLKAGPRR